MSHADDDLEAVEVKGVTRSAFILRGAVAAGGAYGAGMVSPFVRQAFAQGGGGDVEVLSFALTLEHLETAFYMEAAKIDGLSDEAVELVERFGAEEQGHVDALSNMLTEIGGKPAAAPRVDFGRLNDQSRFLKLAVTLEDLGVSAYNGAAPSIASKEILAAAGSIVQVEARHAAALRLLAEREPAPDAFDEARSVKQVQRAVRPFLKS